MVPADDSTAPVIPSGEEIYNSIMSKIEPELTTDQVKLLSEKYKDETPEELAKRKTRYEKARQEYEKQVTEYFNNLEAEVRKHGKESFSTLESKDRAVEKETLNSLETTFSE